MVAKRIVNKVVVLYMIVGHTHDDINVLFGQWALFLRSHDFLTLPMLMKPFMDLDKGMVTPHVIKEVPDKKEFIKPYMVSKSLSAHIKGKQLTVFEDMDGWLLMQLRLKCTDRIWRLHNKPGIGLWQADEYNRLKISLTKNPNALHPSKMDNYVKVIRELGACIAY